MSQRGIGCDRSDQGSALPARRGRRHQADM